MNTLMHFSLSSWHFIFSVWNKQYLCIIKTLPTCWFLQTWLFFPWRSSWQCSLLCLGTPGNSWTWPARQSAPAGWHTAELTPPARTPSTLHPSTIRPVANALSLFYQASVTGTDSLFLCVMLLLSVLSDLSFKLFSFWKPFFSPIALRCVCLCVLTCVCMWTHVWKNVSA